MYILAVKFVPIRKFLDFRNLEKHSCKKASQGVLFNGNLHFTLEIAV